MSALRVLFFVALAIACVFAAEERVKKQVLLGAAASPYAYSAYAAPIAYSAPAYAAPAYAASAYAAPAYGYSAYSGIYGGYNGLYY